MLEPVSGRLFAAGPPSPVCLMYHATPSGIAKSRWDVPINKFKHQLKLLNAYGWQSRLISQINDPAPAKTVFITFDDGYTDNHSAFEALRDNGLVATWFIVADTIGKVSAWEKKQQAQRTMLSVEQIYSMSKAGMEIGSHTCSHPKLTQLSRDECVDELRNSKLTLEDITDKQISTFAYPYGLYNEAIRNNAEEVGYRQACTTHSGFGLVNSDALQIRRVSVYSHDSLSTFARKLVFGDNDAGWGKTASYIGCRLRHKFC